MLRTQLAMAHSNVDILNRVNIVSQRHIKMIELKFCHSKTRLRIQSFCMPPTV